MSSADTEDKIRKKSVFKIILQIVLPLALGILILWFLYRNTNFTEMWATIKDANFAILGFSLIFGLMGNVIRGIRWKLLIEPLGYNPSTSNLIYAVLGNYAVNMVLPRAGEIWRCGITAKTEKIPFVKLIGTLILDRAFDTIMVICITIMACFFNYEVFYNYIKDNESLSGLIENIIASKWLYIAGAAFLVLLFVIFVVLKNSKPVLMLKRFFKELGRDILRVWRMKKKRLFLIYTVSIWVCYFFYSYIALYAFDFTSHLGFTAGLVAFTLGSISVAIPTNGGIGVWHAAIVLALGLYGVNKFQAEAYAFGVFAIQNLWIMLCGLFGILAISFRKQK